MNMLHSAELQELSVDANARIYVAFQGIDAVINRGCYRRSSDPGQLIVATWTADYQ